MTTVEMRNVGVAYRDREVISDVSISSLPGEWIGLIGPNGAGKSSLLRAIGGLVPHSGSITFDGRPLTGSTRSRTVALLPQSPVLPPGMTVGEYVLLGRTAHLGWLASESEHDRLVVHDALDRLDLHDFVSRRVDQLSGGESQRVALARALAQESPVLLLDEPTSALDFGHQLTVLELVNELRCERMLTVIAAMHDLTAAGRVSDRLLLIGEGQVQALGTPDVVLTDEILSPVYGAEVSILEAPDGSLVVVPMRGLHASGTPVS